MLIMNVDPAKPHVFYEIFITVKSSLCKNSISLSNFGICLACRSQTFFHARRSQICLFMNTEKSLQFPHFLWKACRLWAPFTVVFSSEIQRCHQFLSRWILKIFYDLSYSTGKLVNKFDGICIFVEKSLENTATGRWACF